MIEIRIEAHPDRGDMRIQVNDAMYALGFERCIGSVEVHEVETPSGVALGASAPGDENTAPAPEQPKRRRRTKAEMDAERAANGARGHSAAMAAADVVVDENGNVLKDRNGEAAQISTDPENRVGPEDTPETEAQDAADEAAESAAAKTEALTHEDLRAAMGAYANKFGMPAAQSDGHTFYGKVLGEPPAGEDRWRLSLVPEDRIAALIAAWVEAIATNPFNRDLAA